MERPTLSPQLRYAIFYFVVNLGHAVTLAFFPLHCKLLGFSPLEIAVASAATAFATLLGAPGFTNLAHHRVAPRTLLFSSSLIACFLYFPLLRLESFASVFLTWLAFLFANSATGVTVDARAVREATAQEISFERARLWGSIGFIASLALVGACIDIFGLEAIIRLGFIFVCATHAVTYLLRDRMPAEHGAKRATDYPPQVANPFRARLIVVLTAVALVWASHGAYYVYFSIYLKALGWSGKGISLAWNVGVIAEVILFILFHRLTQRWSLKTIFVISAWLTVLRWIVLAISSDPIVLVGIQVLHAFSFGTLYLSSIRLVQQICPADFHERGQGLLSGFSSGGGSLLGRLAFGFIASSIPASTDLYLLFWPAAALAGLGAILGLFIRLNDPE